MKARSCLGFILLAVLVLNPVFSMGQSSCREAKATDVQPYQGFAIHTVSLPYGDSSIEAKAFIPTGDKPLSAVVFSFSAIASSDTDRVVETLPAAIEIAKSGRAAILIQRRLTWRLLDESIGKMGAAVMCEQQWLAAHAQINPKNWLFMGPASDDFSFQQLATVGGAGSMTFKWHFSVGELKDASQNDFILREGSLHAVQAANQIVDF